MRALYSPSHPLRETARGPTSRLWCAAIYTMSFKHDCHIPSVRRPPKPGGRCIRPDIWGIRHNRWRAGSVLMERGSK